MKIGEIYDLFVKKGIDADPRGRKEIEKNLKKTKEKYDKLEKGKKDEFDKEKLTNPFADTRILYGDPKKEIKTVLVGIDMEAQEILLADRLNEKGQKIDLVIAHHPEGRALADLGDVMGVQADIFYKYGVPINVAEGVMAGRINEISRAVAPANHNRAVDTAKVLDIPFMCTHTVADNQVNAFVEKYLEKKKPETVGDVVEALKEIPEYKEAMKTGVGPRIFVGKADSRAGKIAVTGMTGGTEGSKEIYAKMAQAGVGTTIEMHVSEENRKQADKHHINVVIAGHISSDSLGMNLLLDEIEKKGVNVIPCSGLIRVKR